MKTEKTKSIEIKSLRERVLLHEQYFNQECNPTNIQYSPYDGKDQYDATWNINVKDTVISVIAEVKVRNCKNQYEGYMIQKDKYDYLMSQKDNYDFLFYINFFNDGFVVWDLKRIEEPQWTIMKGQKDNFNNEEKMKPAADLMVSDAVRIVKKDIDVIKAYDKATEIWLKRN